MTTYSERAYEYVVSERLTSAEAHQVMRWVRGLPWQGRTIMLHIGLVINAPPFLCSKDNLRPSRALTDSDILRPITKPMPQMFRLGRCIGSFLLV